MIRTRRLVLEFLPASDRAAIARYLDGPDTRGPLYADQDLPVRCDWLDGYEGAVDRWWFSVRSGEAPRTSPFGCIRFDEEGQNRLSLSYFIAPDRRAQGYGSEAVRAVCDWSGLMELGGSRRVRLEAACSRENVASRRVLESARFRFSRLTHQMAGPHAILHFYRSL